DDILEITEIPRKILIVGGGFIGCEFASLFSNFGSEVTIVEMMPQILPGMDKEIARKLEILFKKKGVKVNTNADATKFNLNDFEKALVCVGRQPDTQNLNLDKLGIKTEKNKIIVDDYLRTNIPNIFAAGDCTGKIMLAHYAAYQGEVAAENIANPDAMRKADNSIVPNCIFTDPEIACVGINEEQAGRDVNINKFDFLGSGMARIMEETEGFIKVVSDKNTQEILGAFIIGPKATELITVLALAITNRLKINQVKETIFAHPTLSESLGEAL
ncbi:MAG: FAD-dependent oxidoreductase, partial [Candidatus Omnitrophica bacterium]|nr:FAD-dependent oxidoreductase [Candidatus Omnitrophota bacterium]